MPKNMPIIPNVIERIICAIPCPISFLVTFAIPIITPNIIKKIGKTNNDKKAIIYPIQIKELLFLITSIFNSDFVKSFIG